MANCSNAIGRCVVAVQAGVHQQKRDAVGLGLTDSKTWFHEDALLQIPAK